MADILTLDLSRIPGDFDLVYQDEDAGDMAEEDEIDPLSDEFSPEDSLPPLRRILTYYKSDNNDNRQLCVKLFPEALQSMTTMTEFNMLLQAVFTLARDHYHLIKIGLLTNMPGLLERNNQFAMGEEEIAAENRQQLLDVLIRLLTDTDLEVRRVGQNIIAVCMSNEEDDGHKEELLERLFPVIKRSLGRDENYDLRMDAAMLISRLASQVGQANVLKYFVPLLPSWASDTMFHVRKAFAVCCRELCPVLDEELVEEHILPLYLPLCKDEVWGVRKACADVFSDVSLSCNLGTRYDRMTPVFLALLHDDSRWVRKAAYQSLGAFIATFYIPNGNESLVEQEDEGPTQDESTMGLLSDSMLQDNSLLDSSATTITTDPTSEHRHPSPNTTPPLDDGAISNSSTPIRSGPASRVASDSVSEFNSFEFWRSPIPSVGGGAAYKRAKVVKSENNDAETEVKGKLSFDGPPDENRLSCSDNGCISDGCGETTPTIQSANHAEINGGVALRNNEMAEGEGEAPPSDGQGASEESKVLESEGESLKVVKEIPEQGGGPEMSEGVGGTEGEVRSEGVPIAPVIAANGNTSAPAVVSSHKTITTGAKTDFKLEAASLRVRSSSASAAVRRVSMDQGLMSGQQNDRLLLEKKRRRWSLNNASNHFNNLPQVRVFIHSASGQVTEQELPPSPKEEEEEEVPGPGEKPGGVVQGEEPVDLSHNYTTTKSEAMEMTCEPSTTRYEEEPYIEQEIVPDELMEIYLSMTEHSRVQTVDTDLLYYCAYSLPGVTLTLGKHHWELLKPTFDYLAEDLQWKIRRVLAFSLHELARVLGCEITCRDILPIFEEYCTKDVDDVKIGTLTHLAEFFELLPADFREKCLPRVLEGLLQMENQKNWRYRNTLVEQLLLLCDLFDPGYLHQHIYPLALELSGDKVAEVRSSAGFLIGTLLQKISEGGTVESHTLLQKLRASLVSHPSWLQRLMYVKQCETFLLNKHISQEVFSRECLPSILQLARDRVPNVRIAIAKLLKDSVMQCEYFQSDHDGSFSLEELQITLECLQHDADRDVKFFAGGDMVETPRTVVFTRQWYSHRTRSESHTSSDVDQYQDASDCLTLEMNALALSPSTEVVTSSTKGYLDIDHTHGHASAEYLNLEAGHNPSYTLETGHTTGYIKADHTHDLTSTQLSPASTEDHAPEGLGHTPLLSMDVFTSATGEPIVVTKDIEVSCDNDLGKSGDVLTDQSELKEDGNEKD